VLFYPGFRWDNILTRDVLNEFYSVNCKNVRGVSEIKLAVKKFVLTVRKF
jgi:hypothetical protein